MVFDALCMYPVAVKATRNTGITLLSVTLLTRSQGLEVGLGTSASGDGRSPAGSREMSPGGCAILGLLQETKEK